MARNRPLLIPRPITGRLQPAVEDAIDPGKLYQIAFEMAKERNETLKLLRAAVLRHDTEEVYRLAASLCGLGERHESH